jgi:hypothetical protein
MNQADGQRLLDGQRFLGTRRHRRKPPADDSMSMVAARQVPWHGDGGSMVGIPGRLLPDLEESRKVRVRELS